MELCDKSEENARASNVEKFVAWVVGFEPTVHATKKRCLTAWLHHNSEKLPKSTWLQVQALFTAKFD